MMQVADQRPTACELGGAASTRGCDVACGEQITRTASCSAACQHQGSEIGTEGLRR